MASTLTNRYGNPLISEIDLTKAILQADRSNPTGNQLADTIEMKGAAVFKKDRMMGWLTARETRGAAWILIQTKQSGVTVTDPEHNGKSVSVETRNMKANIHSDIVDGIPKISIQISGEGDVAEEDSTTSQDITEMEKHVGTLISQEIASEVKESLDAIQNKYGTDVLGFAAIVHAQNDREWESGLKDEWQEIFRTTPITVSVHVRIMSNMIKHQSIKIF
ncbi:MAG: Ger(x)C family spore germination C-terminal domain-containing protein [Candidatus Saccharibacteria bacterium]